MTGEVSEWHYKCKVVVVLRLFFDFFHGARHEGRRQEAAALQPTHPPCPWPANTSRRGGWCSAWRAGCVCDKNLQE